MTPTKLRPEQQTIVDQIKVDLLKLPAHITDTQLDMLVFEAEMQAKQMPKSQIVMALVLTRIAASQIVHKIVDVDTFKTEATRIITDGRN